MGEYNEECLKTFLEKQEQLFDEPVAETLEAAEAFLEDCMAVVVESLAEVSEASTLCFSIDLILLFILRIIYARRR